MEAPQLDLATNVRFWYEDQLAKQVIEAELGIIIDDSFNSAFPWPHEWHI